MGPKRFRRAGLAGLLLAALAGPAAAADWQVSTGDPYAKVGYAEGMNFYVLYLFCEGPTGITLNLDDGEGAHRAGSRVSVAVLAAGRRHAFEGRVETNEMDGTSMISVPLEPDAASSLFADLSAAPSAQVVWPKARLDLPLGGSRQAIAAFRRSC